MSNNKVKKTSSKVSGSPSAICSYEKCPDEAEKFGLCRMHHDWFMAGLLLVDGAKHPDFSERFKDYIKEQERLATKKRA